MTALNSLSRRCSTTPLALGLRHSAAFADGGDRAMISPITSIHRRGKRRTDYTLIFCDLYPRNLFLGRAADKGDRERVTSEFNQQSANF